MPEKILAEVPVRDVQDLHGQVGLGIVSIDVRLSYRLDANGAIASYIFLQTYYIRFVLRMHEAIESSRGSRR